METKRKFQLDKSSTRNFDVSKGSKRKFDLSKDNVVTSANTKENTPKPDDNSNNNKGKKWLWIIAVIVVLVLLVWWLIPKSQDASSEEQQPTEDVTNTVDSTDPESPTDTSKGNTAGDAQNPQNFDEPEVTSNPEPTPIELQQNENEQPANTTVYTGTSTISGDVEAEALKVIRGYYGIGQERKDKLGEKYKTIQTRVNELKREGLF